MNEKTKTRLLEINKSILNSYQIGGINNTEGTNLPSYSCVVNIIDMFQSIIFPGYRNEEKLETELLQYTIGAKTRSLVRDLMIEISRSLEYAGRIKGEVPIRGTCLGQAESITLDLLALVPALRESAMGDVEAAFSGDPAAFSREEIIMAYPGLKAITCHRIAHELYKRDIPLIPRMISEYIHSKTGVDIHPGASIGHNFFIDHATGVVIGETAVIGDNVKIYQGVTIGALSVNKNMVAKKRHPTIEDYVTIYAGTTILGGKTIIGKGSVIGGNVWITESVSPYSVVYNRAADHRIKNRNGDQAFDNWSI